MVVGYRRGTTELKLFFSKAHYVNSPGQRRANGCAGVDSRCVQCGTRKLGSMSGVFHLVLDPMRRLRIAAVVIIAFSPGAHAGDAVVGRASPADISERVVELVNAARSNSRRCGSERYAAAPSLRVSQKLNKAAAGHARDMARRKFFEHRGSDGSQPKDRVLRAGYQPRLTGENIAYGPESAEEVVAGWLASPGHCANIMDSRFHDIGVALNTGKKRGQIYWVQNFGAPILK